MLNTVLTVVKASANSHAKRGWEEFTDSVISGLAEQRRPIVFLLWGKPAQVSMCVCMWMCARMCMCGRIHVCVFGVHSGTCP
jgi:uracil DNA glycosylase